MKPSFLKDKVVLITGGTGTFGRMMAKKLLSNDLCSKVIIYSRDEWKQWEMQQTDPIFNHPKIRYFLGDVRDKERLGRALRDVQIVIHAAALKQVPAAEYNPSEFIKTNILGSMNIIDVAIDKGVEKVLALSTDKAVNPANLYGASKLCAEKLFISGNSYVGARVFPKLGIVRYGNVIGSRGSVIPLWKKLIAEGATSLPITDERMTRFWITIENTTEFVLQCLELMQGGEIFIPKIPSVTISDLATGLAPHLSHKITGIREGEKLHEVLLNEFDAQYAMEYPNYYVILPPLYKKNLDERKKKLNEQGNPLPSGFIYASDTNPQWLDADQVREILKKDNMT